MKQNHKTMAGIDRKRANSWPFLTFSSVAEKNLWLAVVREVILTVGDMR